MTSLGREPHRAERQRILYSVHSLNPGGTERLVFDMALAFNADYQISVVCLDEPGAWAQQLRDAGVPVYCVWRQPGFDLNAVGRIASLAKKLQVDLIHAHQYTPWFYCALSRMLNSAPKLLFQEHGRFYPEVENRRRALFNRAILVPLTHRAVAVSDDVRHRLDAYEWVPASRIEVIYNGTRARVMLADDERARLRRELGFSDSDFVVGTVGRFDSIKNLPLLISAISRVRARHANVHGLLVGDGPETSSVRAHVKHHALQDVVALTGHRDDADSLMQCMDLFVLSSFSEGTSMALLEAMSQGVAAVVTDVGGNPEVVERGATGWVVPSGDVDRMSGAIREAVEDPERRRQYAQGAVARFRARFTTDEMLRHYRELYRGMLAAELKGVARCGTP